MSKMSLFYLRDATFDPEETPLPLQVYSVGERILKKDECSHTPAAKNSFVELQWSISGIGEIEFFDRSYEMRENDVFLWLPGEAHHQCARSESWTVRWLCFDGPLAEAIVLGYRLPRHIHTQAAPPKEIFDEFAQNAESHSYYQRGHLAALTMELLANLRKEQSTQSESLVECCIQYIHQHYGDPEFCIKTLCEEFRISRSSLFRLFLKEAHLPLGRYIRNVRYGNALALLRNTTLPTNEIATRCGYSSYPSFCRLIHRGTGFSPGDYRKTAPTIF